jgi:ornithine cyclodeaminase/alanine dehydrogenase-like protein (mu-crystallin family)
MGEIVAKLKPGRESDEERILSVPVGMGTQDIAIGWTVYQSAIEKRLGKSFNFL